jgi:hypothetical protein
VWPILFQKRNEPVARFEIDAVRVHFAERDISERFVDQFCDRWFTTTSTR